VVAAAERDRVRLPGPGVRSPLPGRRAAGVGGQRQLDGRVHVGLAGAELLVVAGALAVPGHGGLAADLDLDAANTDLVGGGQLDLTSQHLSRLILVLLVDVVLKVDLQLLDR